MNQLGNGSPTSADDEPQLPWASAVGVPDVRHLSDRPQESTELDALDDPDAAHVAAVVDALVRETSGTIRMAHPDVALSAPEQLPSLAEQVAAGRVLRGVYDAESVHTRSLEVNQWAALGEEQRLATHLPTEFISFGTDVVIMSAQWGGVGPYRIVREPSVVAALITLFDSIWDAAADVDEGVDTQSDELVDLLAQGLRDEAIASALGTSVRATRKRIDGLMRECGAQTRFALALSLVERGTIKLARDAGESELSNR